MSADKGETMREVERRVQYTDIEYRAASGRRNPVMSAYAAVFDKDSADLGGFVERMVGQPFTKTIKEQDIVGLLDHDPGKLLGRTSSGTLNVSQDEVGLRYDLELPNTTLGHDVAELVSRGDLTGSSVGMRVFEDGWTRTDSGYPLRSVRVAGLRDLGPTTFPAYAGTSDAGVALRSLAELRSLPYDEVVDAAASHRLGELMIEQSDMPGRVNLTELRRRRLFLLETGLHPISANPEETDPTGEAQ